LFYKVANNLAVGIKAGQYLADRNKELLSNTEIVKGTILPKTANQNNGNNAIAAEKFKKTGGKNNINKNLIYIGVKGYYRLFGSKIENAAGFGINCFFSGVKSTLQAETDWLTINRTIVVTDTIAGLSTNLSEPISAKTKTNTTYKRNTFLTTDWSYQIKYKLNSKLYIVNEIGLLLGDLTIAEKVEVNAEYNYINGNRYNDEISASKKYRDTRRANFDQIYLHVGLIF